MLNRKVFETIEAILPGGSEGNHIIRGVPAEISTRTHPELNCLASPLEKLFSLSDNTYHRVEKTHCLDLHVENVGIAFSWNVENAPCHNALLLVGI
jgi:hypothetical protein